jgi:alpha-1,3-rhamnosyl/mannosyltransferase
MPVVLDARTATDHFPGIGRYVVNLAYALARLAPDLGLSLLFDPTATATRLALPNLPKTASPVSPFSLRQQWRVPSQLRQLEATLYHSPYYLMPYWPGVATVLTCYDLIPLRYPEYCGAAQRLIFRLAHRLAINTARMVLAISEVTKADLVHFFQIDPTKIVVTPLAADPHFQPQPLERLAALRQKYDLPETYMLYFGSNKPHKNLVRLVEASGKFAMRNAQSRIALVVAGHWDNRYPQAKQIVEERGWQEQIRFIGQVTEADLPALYGGATLFVFPSLYEGFGLPVLEAMACGTPVVCANTSSLPEVAGDAALLFNPVDVDSLTQTLTAALNDANLRADLQRRSLARAAQFMWERSAAQTLGVYLTVSGERHD